MESPNWSERKIIQELKKLDRLEVSLAADYIAKVDPNLYRAAQDYFPHWQDALLAAGKGYRTDRP